MATPAGVPAAPVTATTKAAGDTRWVLVALVSMIGMFLSAFDASVISTAVPAIRATFTVSADDAAWVTIAFTATQAAALPASAWLATRVGPRRTYLVALGLFALTSILCSTAWDLGSLIAFRMAQAVPGALTAAVCLAIIYQVVPPRNRQIALVLYASGIVAAPGLAPLLAGWVVQHDAWRMIFYVDAPLAALAAVVALLVLPDLPGRPRRYDALGHLSAAAALCAGVVAVNRVHLWGVVSYPFLGLVTIGVLAAALFVVIELEVAEPLLDLRAMFRRSYLVMLLVLAVMFAGNTIVTGFVQAFLGGAQAITPIGVGLVLLPQALVWIAVLPVGGLLLARVGPRMLMVAGLLLIGVSFLTLTGTTVDGDRVVLAGLLVLRSLGLGLVLLPTMASGMAVLPDAELQDGSALQTIFQRSTAGILSGGLVAWQTHLGAQAVADRAALVPQAGGNGDLAAVVRAGRPALAGYWQQLQVRSTLVAWSDILLVTGLLTLVVAILVLVLAPRRLGA